MNTLKFYRQTALRALWQWLLMIVSGGLMSMLGITIAVVMFGNPTASADLAGSGSFPYTPIVWPILLLTISLVFLVVYVVLAGKVTLHGYIHQLYAQQLAPVIERKLSGILSTLILQKPEWWHAIDNAQTFKTKFTQTSNQAPIEPSDDGSMMQKLQRKAMLYALSRADLEGVNFNPANPQLANDIGGRVMAQLDTLAEPMSTLYWIALGFHLVCILLIWVLGQ